MGRTFWRSVNQIFTQSPDYLGIVRVDCRWKGLFMLHKVAVTVLGIAATTAAMPAVAEDHSGRRVFFVDSYDTTMRWSQDLETSIRQTLEPHGVELRIFHMDTKRKTSTAHKEKVAAEAKAIIAEFEPDVVIATDDNAQIHLIAPNYVGTNLPVVFAGVNAEPSRYGYPARNVTGMQEVNPLGGLINLLSAVTGGGRIGYLTLDNETERAQLDVSKRQVKRPVEARFVTDFDSWKQAFLDLQGQADFILVGPLHGLRGFDSDRAKAFLRANMRVPTGSWQAGMRDFVFLTLEKTGTEQGSWAASAALSILNGTSPGDIPIAQNTQGNMALNARIADAIGMQLPPGLVEIADVIIE